MVVFFSSHMVSVMVSILSQIPPVQWKISDTFKIKKPVKSLRAEVIFAIMRLIKMDGSLHLWSEPRRNTR